MNLFRRKNIDGNDPSGKKMKKTLGTLDLILLGVGCIVGTGIFVLTGTAAARYAGPGIILSFAITGIACLLTALVYAELSAMIPASGSSYTYTYAGLGEIFAWTVGWALILEYLIAACMVSVGWSAYATGMLASAGIMLPSYLTSPPMSGGLINLPAIGIALLIGLMLVRGTKESSNLNKLLVFLKLFAISLFLLLAVPHIQTVNWDNFLPFGTLGILAGSAIVFTAFIGFDAISTAAEESKNPGRDVPIGIICSIIICTILYILVAATLTGVVPYLSLDNPEPVTFALRAIGNNWGAALVGAGAIAGMTSVLLVLFFGLTRVIFAMSRDNLFPATVSKIHCRYGTPYRITIISCIIIAIISGFMPIHKLAELVNIGTLFAFAMTSAGALALRYRLPDLPRPFRCPSLKIVAPLAMISCIVLMFMLPFDTWVLFLAWLGLGMIVYFSFGYQHSVLNTIPLGGGIEAKESEAGTDTASIAVPATEL